MALLEKIFGSANTKQIKEASLFVSRINELEKGAQVKTEDLKKRIQEGESLDNILPEAFAAVREAAKQTLNQRHFDVQLIGGTVLHQGNIAEMRTGEGKTLTATLAVYLNALEEKGVHVITVNDYLAKRDTVWMGQIYHELGLTIGCITHDSSYIYDPNYQTQEQQSEISDGERDEERDKKGSFKVEESYLKPVTRKEAYAADITYGTNNEFGFDYLRDNMAQDVSLQVQRGNHFAVIDEIDSVLIDEARTPLIISAPDQQSSQWYHEFAKITPQLSKETDYEIDEKMKAVTITDAGIDKVEKVLGIGDIYQEKGMKYVHHLEQALKAEALFKKDKDYVVKDGQIMIIDEFTGRMLEGRRYSGGLHQALEAKEGVQVQPESMTFASITFQNYFRMYKKLAGMTGTAATSAEEFFKVYGLDVVMVPTNKPTIRKDLPDKIYKTLDGKFKAVVQEIKARHEKGQPVLVGTVSIEKNEYISRILDKEGVSHQVLNAKQHEKEGEIIA
ncbi:preprotein translocase subunit SecA, partial [Patescibacteria group bacterium]|nr:preprotein translocase subunit SecA [Patescibacteria group bacterium]